MICILITTLNELSLLVLYPFIYPRVLLLNHWLFQDIDQLLAFTCFKHLVVFDIYQTENVDRYHPYLIFFLLGQAQSSLFASIINLFS